PLISLFVSLAGLYTCKLPVISVTSKRPSGKKVIAQGAVNLVTSVVVNDSAGVSSGGITLNTEEDVATEDTTAALLALFSLSLSLQADNNPRAPRIRTQLSLFMNDPF